MGPEMIEKIDTTTINEMLRDLYKVCQEIAVSQAMYDELTVGPRNANDVFAISRVREKLRELRNERAAIRRAIHEEPTTDAGNV